MFESEYFTGSLRIFYIHKFIENEEIIDFLLKNMKNDEFNFYLL